MKPAGGGCRERAGVIRHNIVGIWGRGSRNPSRAGGNRSSLHVFTDHRRVVDVMSDLMVSGEVLLGISLVMFVAALIGVYGDRMLANRR
jgi:hypothetical protein